jgi:hypothetical protein
MKLQRRAYKFERQPDVCFKLLNVTGMGENEAYEKSKKIEPRKK